MRLRTLFLYLIGNREAILALAVNRWSLVLGAIFVLSAALARDYDGEDLLHEPWHLLVPFAASLLASFVLFVLAWWGCRWSKGAGPGFRRTYAAFLGLFWMTAPLAWLYAIPYERFLGPVEAVRANLATLGLVAAWRVALMVRVLNVALNYRLLDAIFVVMAFGDLVAMIAVAFLPVNLMEVMSGVRGSSSDEELKDIGCGVLQLGICSGLFWLPALLTTITSGRKNSLVPSWPLPGGQPSAAVWGLALGSILIWAPLLPVPQAEQQLRRKVEQDFRDGQIEVALAEMSGHSMDDFPPHWQPPPRFRSLFADSDKEKQLLAIWEVLVVQPPAPWVRELYVGKLRDFLLNHSNKPSEEKIERWAEILTKLPEGPVLLSELKTHWRERAGYPHWLWPALPERLRPKIEEK